MPAYPQIVGDGLRCQRTCLHCGRFFRIYLAAIDLVAISAGNFGGLRHFLLLKSAFFTFLRSKYAVELPKSKTTRYNLLYLSNLAISFGPFILLAVALLAVAYWWPDPNPPKRVTLATSPTQSTYEEFGKRYVKAF